MILQLLSAFGIGTVLGSVATLLVKDQLSRRAELRHRRIETDRATYQERTTRLIAANLCALIRSDRYRDGDRGELEELVQNLSNGTHCARFLDPIVQRAWADLVRKSAECGWQRLAGVITERDIIEYTRIWEAWLLAARESFGPLPEADSPQLRGSRTADQIIRVA